MQFQIPRPAKVANINISKYTREEIDIARSFTKKLFDEFGAFLKGTILFGSSARGQNKSKGDIDVLVVVDDLTMKLTPEIVQTYRIIVEKIIVDVSHRLHITTLKYSSFWEYARIGDPVAINILRDGVALLDTGFFDPLQSLLLLGKVRPTPEAVWTYYSRAPSTLDNADLKILNAVVDLYWAAIDAAHAALMNEGIVPPSPAHVANLLEEHFVKKGKMSHKYAEAMRLLYALSKKVVHREVKHISGSDYDKYSALASDFVNHMRKFVK